nr:unnamed protein product [Meloidogyne enterolobii]
MIEHDNQLTRCSFREMFVNACRELLLACFLELLYKRLLRQLRRQLRYGNPAVVSFVCVMKLMPNVLIRMS